MPFSIKNAGDGMELSAQVIEWCKKAKEASEQIALLSSQLKNEALEEMAIFLEKNQDFLLEENSKDLSKAKEKKLSAAMIDRLALDPSRIKAMAHSLREVAQLPDPVGEVVRMWKRPNNLLVGKVRIPLGVIGIIYESRPNVTCDAAALCLKSGNAVILRGGSEAIHSNLDIGKILRQKAQEKGIPEDFLQVIPITQREVINYLLEMDEYIDLIIPRGGEDLIRFVSSHSKIPVIKHYKGVCHIFVDSSADLEMAEKICFNAKVQRPGVCNAMETLLVHAGISREFLPRMVKKFKEAGVEIRGCPRTREIVEGIEEAKEQDWYEEYLDLILSIKIVDGLDEAIAHIKKYGSQHTESIITQDYNNSQRFLNEVNSSVVLVNASTRFNDGNQLGLGAEIGISTTKIHSFGPMGLEDLTTTKFIVYGSGQIRV